MNSRILTLLLPLPDRNHPENGVLLRLDTASVGMDSTISDAKESGWTLSFKE